MACRLITTCMAALRGLKLPRPRRILAANGLCLAGVAWGVALIAVWVVLLDHAYRPAKAAVTLNRVALEPAAKFRVILFAHPLCPCTRASMHELSESLARISTHAVVRVVFVTAGLEDSRPQETELLQVARGLGNVEVQFDRTGAEASRYGATISGEVLAFSPSGELVFQGGITPGRGHQGDASGQRQLELLVTGAANRFCSAPVYGCPLPVK